MLEISDLLVQRGTGDTAFCVHMPYLQLAAGEVVAITGESGCGKSTLLEALGLLLTPRELKQYFLGSERRDITQAVLLGDEHLLPGLRARQLGFVLQNGGLLPYLKVRENISLPRRLLGLHTDAEFVEEAIDVLRLRALLDQMPSTLSIGERQRVACIRALAHKPQILLADEPTAALDPSTARIFFGLLLKLVSQLQLAAIVVSHDWELIDSFGLLRYQANTGERRSCFEPMDI